MEPAFTKESIGCGNYNNPFDKGMEQQVQVSETCCKKEGWRVSIDDIVDVAGAVTAATCGCCSGGGSHGGAGRLVAQAALVTLQDGGEILFPFGEGDVAGGRARAALAGAHGLLHLLDHLQEHGGAGSPAFGAASVAAPRPRVRVRGHYLVGRGVDVHHLPSPVQETVGSLLHQSQRPSSSPKASLLAQNV